MARKKRIEMMGQNQGEEREMGGDLEQSLDALPGSPGVYLFRDARQRLLYVGKARDLRQRVRSHFQSRPVNARQANMVEAVRSIDVVLTKSETEALVLENSLIKNNKPIYNVMLRDDKTYPYACITKETFPRVIVTRVRQGGRGRFFGPFPSARAVRQAIRLIHQYFKIRNCRLDLSRQDHRPCLQYHFGRCDAPCAGWVTAEQYAEGVHHAELFLSGKTDHLIRKVSDAMTRASRALAFERAAYYRDLLGQLTLVQRSQVVDNVPYESLDAVGYASAHGTATIVVLSVRNQRLSRTHHFSVEWETEPHEDLSNWLTHFYIDHQDPPREILGDEVSWLEPLQQALSVVDRFKVHVLVPRRGAKRRLLDMARETAIQQATMKGLGEDATTALHQISDWLTLPALPLEIECFDISHLQGTHQVASMVRFSRGEPAKRYYRRFQIRSVQGADDYAAMREVIHRRYQRLLRENQTLPDLVVVDGGLGQLRAAWQALEDLKIESLPLISLAKREEWIFSPQSDQPLKLPKREPGLRLLQFIRDEAHRFGVTYHRKKRGSAAIQSELLEIPGVGPRRLQRLLRHFGAVDAIRTASLEQLARVVGPKTAATLHEYLS